MNTELIITKVRTPGKVPYALTEGTRFIELQVDSPAWQVAKRMYDRGDCHPLVVMIIESSHPAFVSYARDARDLFTVCSVICNGALYTGVAKRSSYARGGDNPTATGRELSFYRALCSRGVTLPALQGALFNHVEVDQPKDN